MQKSALIMWGGWEGHTPLECAVVVKAMLENNGYEVTTEEGTAALTEFDPATFDLIVPMITQSTIEKDELQNLIAAVRGGTGLAGFHGGMCDAFRAEPDYQFMTGGQWVAHPGNIIDYTVNVTRPDDPVMEGIGDFPYRSEQYFLHVDPGIEVLATTTFSGEHAPETEGVVMPVVWKRRFGEGRVFYSALGHTVDEFDVPEMRRILERGLVWASR